ncbi:MAG TPA: hypothetical protein VMU47_25220 [Caldimonas sp.]|nr:hypothetical protein [Caldimonas sp.]
MRIQLRSHALPSITALGAAVVAGLLECLALWRSRRRARRRQTSRA